MKNLSGYMLVLSLLFAPGRAAEWQSLFDGTLEGWRTWLSFPEPGSHVAGVSRGADGKYAEKLGWDRDPLQVFTVVQVDGRAALRASGEVFGLILTKEPHRNFHLRFQFKWGEKKWVPRLAAVRDSGLLYFINGEQGRSYVSWPSCLELQIQEKDTGDLFALLSQTKVRARRIGADAKGNPHWLYDPTATPVRFEQEGKDGNRVIRQQDHEKPHGEWNTIELICFGADSIHIVNGQVVMRLAGARKQPGGEVLDEGLIGLQSEGAEVFFRDIAIQPITAIPAEYAEK
ncbi:MAG TPA: DUF1080 domain-containing protein [Lacunisphaera sp.]|nr:DUF1080 domain-containing protein [Lacunisphaera sp.]